MPELINEINPYTRQQWSNHTEEKENFLTKWLISLSLLYLWRECLFFLLIFKFLSFNTIPDTVFLYLNQKDRLFYHKCASDLFTLILVRIFHIDKIKILYIIKMTSEYGRQQKIPLSKALTEGRKVPKQKVVSEIYTSDNQTKYDE